MSEKGYERYLVAMALLLLAVIILFNAFNTPAMNAVELLDGNSEKSVIQMAEFEDITQNQSGSSSIENKSGEKLTNASESKQISGDAVNVNTATVDELMTVKGIGEVKAQAIIDYRTENGKFTSIEDVKNVKGIGEKTFENLKKYITI